MGAWAMIHKIDPAAYDDDGCGGCCGIDNLVVSSQFIKLAAGGGTQVQCSKSVFMMVCVMAKKSDAHDMCIVVATQRAYIVSAKLCQQYNFRQDE